METAGIVVYAGMVTLEKSIHDSVWGMYIFLKMKQEPEQRGSVHPMRKFTTMRKGRVGSRFSAVFTLSDGAIFYDNEVMLKNWGDSASGWTLHLWVNADNAGFHPFLGCDAKTLFGLAMVELDDDNEVIDQDKRERLESVPKKRAELTLSNYAATLCRAPEFMRYLGDSYGVGAAPEDATKVAAAWMRDFLGISSRAELDSNDERAAEFHYKVRKPYAQWYKKRNP